MWERRPTPRRERGRAKRERPSPPSTSTEPATSPADAPRFGGGKSSRDGAAKESNLPTAGLRRPAGFEDRMGHQARAAPRRRLGDARGEQGADVVLDGPVVPAHLAVASGASRLLGALARSQIAKMEFVQ